MTTNRPSSYWLRRGTIAAVMAFSGLLLAGTGTPEKDDSAAVAAVKAYVPSEDPRDLLKLDDDMRLFFLERVTDRHSDGNRLRQIVEAIVTPRGLNFVYDGEATLDARATFHQQRGNCVSFALLVVAIARYFEYDASFQTVDVPAKWDRFGENIVSVQHLNVRVDASDGSYIVDLRPDLVPRAYLYSGRVVPDERAFADFYSNVGFFRLVDGRNEEALHYMVLATEVDRRSACAWANRATLHSRAGDLQAARACFERALRLDSTGFSSLVGYVNVLQQLGTPEDLRLAQKLERRAQTLREQNPYYQEYLAQRAREKGELDVAAKHLRRALSLKDDEPAFYEQWIEVLRQLGRTREANRADAKLKQLRERLASAPVHISVR